MNGGRRLHCTAVVVVIVVAVIFCDAYTNHTYRPMTIFLPSLSYLVIAALISLPPTTLFLMI
jgi:hypothetical protein